MFLSTKDFYIFPVIIRLLLPKNIIAFSGFECCLKKKNLKLILGRQCNQQLDRTIYLLKHYAVISNAKGFVSIRLYYFIIGKTAHQKI